MLPVSSLVWSAGSHLSRIKHPAPSILADRLTSFDTKTRLEKFSKTNYACQVCLSSIKGAKCTSLACGHVFCRACLVDFWGLCISEGDVDRVGCPDPGCVKQGTKASEEDVRRVVSTEEVRRWKWLKDKKELEKGVPAAETLFGPDIYVCRSDNCPLPDGFLPAPGKEADAGGDWEWMGETTDMHVLWLFLLCILP